MTADTSHAERSRLKALALSNIPHMLVTAETSHADMSWLKRLASWNTEFICVTAETSHAPMTEPPCCPGQRPSGDSLVHNFTACLSVAWDVKTGTAAVRVNPNSRSRAPRGRVVPPARGATCSEWGGGGGEAAGTWRSPRRGRLAARHSVAHAARPRAVRARAWARAKPQ